MHVIFKASLGLIGVLALGCATTQDPETQSQKGIAAFAQDVRLGEQVSRICFASQIDGFRAASKDTVIVESGLRKEFILETMGSCQNLRHAQAIGLEKGISCLTEFDNILVFDSAFGTQSTPFSNERCAIKSIHRWNEDVDPVDLEGIPPEDLEPIMAPLK